MRPVKRRKVHRKKQNKVASDLQESKTAIFQPLFDKAIGQDDSIQLRQDLFEEAWSNIDSRIRVSWPFRLGLFLMQPTDRKSMS